MNGLGDLATGPQPASETISEQVYDASHILVDLGESHCIYTHTAQGWEPDALSKSRSCRRLGRMDPE